MEYTIIAFTCLIIGFLLSYIILKQNKNIDVKNLSSDIKHLLEIQKKDWEKGQVDFRGVLNPLKDNLKNLDKFSTYQNVLYNPLL